MHGWGDPRHVSFRSHNENVTVAGLEPGPPDPRPIAYWKQNREEWVAVFLGQRGKGTGVRREEGLVWPQTGVGGRGAVLMNEQHDVREMPLLLSGPVNGKHVVSVVVCDFNFPALCLLLPEGSSWPDFTHHGL